MEYKLVVPLSKFHRGTLQVSWAPQADAPADPTNNQYNHIFDVAAGEEWRFRVGYAVLQPMLEGYPLASTDAVVTTAGANGCLRIGVVNPLQAQVATAGTSVFVFARVCPGAQYAVPRTVWAPVTSEEGHSVVDFSSTVTVQGGALGDEQVTIHEVDLVPTRGRYPAKEMHVGEEVLSARTLAQKFSHDVNFGRAIKESGSLTYLVNHFPQAPSEYQHIGLWPSPPSTTPYLPVCFSWFGWYAALFVGVAGSVRYKVVNAGEDPIPVAIWAANTTPGVDSTTPLLGAATGQVAPTWVAPQGGAVEVTVPYYFNRNYIPTFGRISAHTTAQGAPGRVNVVKYPQLVEATDANKRSVVVYVAGGPDLRFFTARFPPKVQYKAGSSNPKYGNPYYTA